jgi:hypothetical protein
MNHLSACKRQAVETKSSQRDMNCATNQRKASCTTTATLDLIQDLPEKERYQAHYKRYDSFTPTATRYAERKLILTKLI